MAKTRPATEAVAKDTRPKAATMKYKEQTMNNKQGSKAIKNTNRPTLYRLLAAYDRRVKYAMHKATPSKLKRIVALMIGFGLLGLVFPLTAIVVAFFGIVESIRLARPSWFPFTFSKRLLYGLRLATLLYFALGVVGIVINWSDIYPYIKPVIDWVNE